jgi:hypothetical protein
MKNILARTFRMRHVLHMRRTEKHMSAVTTEVPPGVELKIVRVEVFPDGRVDRKNAAAFLGREPKTLAEWRSKGIGPRPVAVGGRIFYWWAELQEFARGKAA